MCCNVCSTFHCTGLISSHPPGDRDALEVMKGGSILANVVRGLQGVMKSDPYTRSYVKFLNRIIEFFILLPRTSLCFS